MGPSLRGTSLTSGVPRPGTRDTNRPGIREQFVDTNIVPCRTSSLISPVTQPLPATITKSDNPRTPKTLTHAYMVCGVGREPWQWVKAPAPSHGKIQHMKGAIRQFWLPEILGSSPRLESDNEIARALHSAMRVNRSFLSQPSLLTPLPRLAFLMMLKFALATANLTAFTTRSSSNKTPNAPSMALPFEFGPGRMRNEQRQSANFAERQSPSTETLQTKDTGFLTA